MFKLRICIATIVLYGYVCVVMAGQSIESVSTLRTDAPSYESGILIIPRIDSPEQVGRYQDVIFRFDQQLNTWVLQYVNSMRNHGPRIWSVDVRVVDDSFPIQVFLQVTGDHGCGGLGQINTRRSGDLFEVQISEIQLGPEVVCTADIKKFVRIVALDVYGLSAGEYQYIINDGNLGTFRLVRDNIFAEECGGSGNAADSRCESKEVISF